MHPESRPATSKIRYRRRIGDYNNLTNDDAETEKLHTKCARAAVANGVRDRVPTSSPAKMFGKLQALRLIVRADAVAVEGVGPRQHALVD